MRESEPSSMPPLTLVYDGTCNFCIAGTARLLRLARPGAVVRMSSQDPALAQRFPHLAVEDAPKSIRLVRPDGSVAVGAAAIAEVMGTRAVWRWVPLVHRLPLLRQIADLIYGLVAKNRHRLMGRACEDGSCAVGPSDR